MTLSPPPPVPPIFPWLPPLLSTPFPLLSPPPPTPLLLSSLPLLSPPPPPPPPSFFFRLTPSPSYSLPASSLRKRPWPEDEDDRNDEAEDDDEDEGPQPDKPEHQGRDVRRQSSWRLSSPDRYFSLLAGIIEVAQCIAHWATENVSVGRRITTVTKLLVKHGVGYFGVDDA
ncbi:uncharacterized protein B0T23DRAFT_396285 [Neurospora hispaniola]|uniref:Uncharacterized protein n=1 Tax=Neurospora hispaniola TaxID=588809 RepID=A0AAJ0MS02_9PEZI|nr:hypothetical protein B0T23DRAFT_396285 [Neurospora hispaniola]